MSEKLVSLSAGAYQRALIEQRARAIRRKSILAANASGFGFIGSCCSCADILATLSCLADRDPKLSIVLSKGHAAAALYALHDDFDETAYARSTSRFQGHPNELAYPALGYSSGSLGLAVPAAIGRAIACGLRGEERHTCLVLGDGEIQAGVVWESILALRHYSRPTAVTLIVDANGWQSNGAVTNTAWLRPMLAGLVDNMTEIDGNQIDEVHRAIASCVTRRGITAIWAKTRRGAGLSGYEESWPMSYIPNQSKLQEWVAALSEHNVNNAN